MLITVGICTWNRSALLDQTLVTLRDVRVPPGVEWEVLVINNNCTDDTDAVIERHRAHLPLTRLFEKEPGLSSARNCGLDHARGDLVLWTDDDVKVSPGWLEAAAEGAERFPEAAGFAGPIRPWFPVKPDPQLMQAFPALKNGFCGLDLGESPREMTGDEFAYGANMLYRSSAVAGLRFNPALGPKGAQHGIWDDVEYQKRNRAGGGTFAWLPGMAVEHYVDPSRMTLQYLTTYYYGAGQSDAKRDGVPSGPRLFGTPRYLLRMAAERYVKYCANRLRGRQMMALEHLRSYHYYRGVIGGCRAIAKAEAHG